MCNALVEEKKGFVVWKANGSILDPSHTCLASQSLPNYFAGNTRLALIFLWYAEHVIAT